LESTVALEAWQNPLDNHVLVVERHQKHSKKRASSRLSENAHLPFDSLVINDSTQTTSGIDHNLPLPDPPWE
jgi:hypothetical protein